MRIINATLEKFDKIKILVDSPIEFRSYKFHIKNNDIELNVKKYSTIENTITLMLNSKVNIKSESFIIYEDLYAKVHYFPLFSTKEFDDKFCHHSTLGMTYSKTYSVFRLWSPVASCVNLLLYDKGEPTVSEKQLKIPMKETNGLWTALIKGDLNGYYYNYEIKIYNNLSEIVDPYAKAVGINGLRGAILDMSKTNPEGWENDKSPPLDNYTNAIIYECSIRDISSHNSSGVKYSGKFLALTENTTFSKKNISTCLSHIKELGITHLQLMPIFDFSYVSVDEKNPIKYNWGYDPQNYNVPEGSYSTNPFDPACRIQELKQMIQHLHKNNICINMDVVYNHIAERMSSNLEKVFPGYYFRHYETLQPSNGSGCGNDIASERSMVQKFIVDSVVHWAREYHIDGFRFDLMGLLDIVTMNLIRQKLKSLNKSIILYGEGWDLDTALNDNLKATKANVSKLYNIAFFNEKLRDCIKGDVFNVLDRGFATGKPLMEEDLKKNISGYHLNPNQSINYTCCHDNHTLWDKISLSCKNESLDNRKRMVKLCAAIILTSQGIPFIYSGEEFCRTKNGEHNSFNKPDYINCIDWSRKPEFIDIFSYYKELIKIRKHHPAFRMSNIVDVNINLSFLDNLPESTVAFTLKNYCNGDSWREILVVYNANNFDVNLDIPEGPWNIALGDTLDSPNSTIVNNFLNAKKICAYILYKL